jgi:hypothetical protein
VAALRRAAVTSPWPWTVVLPGEATADPAVELSFGTSTRRVSAADEVHDAIRALTAGGAR